MVVAEPPYAEGEGDSATLALPADDLAVVARVRKLVDRLVVVVLSGRPVMLDEVLPSADAVVAAWLPGTEGAGVADVLLGDAPFRGTTPVHLAADPRRRPANRQGAVRWRPIPGSATASTPTARSLGGTAACPVR